MVMAESHYIMLLRKGRLEVVQLLHRHGADVNVRDNEGQTPLHAACRFQSKYYIRIQEYESVVRLLLENGARPDTKDKRGRTPADVLKDSWKFQHDPEAVQCILSLVSQ